MHTHRIRVCVHSLFSAAHTQFSHEYSSKYCCFRSLFGVIESRSSRRFCSQLLAQTTQEGTIDAYNNDLHVAISLGPLEDFFRVCKKIKHEGLRPNQLTYSLLLEAYTIADPMKVFDTYKDICNTGISLNVKMLTAIMKACELITDSARAAYYLEEFRKRGVYPDDICSFTLINLYAKTGEVGNMWKAYQTVRGSLVRMAPIKNAFTLLMSANKPALVLELIEDVEPILYDFKSRVLDFFVQQDYLPGVQFFERMKDRLTLGELLSILTVAGRCKDHGLAIRMFDEISKRMSPPQALYYNALLFAHANCNKLEHFMDTVNDMDKCGYTVGLPFRKLFAQVCISQNALEKAYFYATQKSKAEPKAGLELWNTIIYAYSYAGMPQVNAVFNQIKDLGIAANTDTYNSLMQCSRETKTAFDILDNMKQNGVEATSGTYEALMSVCKMKHDRDKATQVFAMVNDDGLVATYQILADLCYICVVNGDLESGKQIKNSMLKLGMTPNASLLSIFSILSRSYSSGSSSSSKQQQQQQTTAAANNQQQQTAAAANNNSSGGSKQ